MYAAQFMASMKKNSRCELSDWKRWPIPIFTWLESNIWSKGSLLTTDDLVKVQQVKPLNAHNTSKDHLRSRYLKGYIVTSRR